MNTVTIPAPASKSLSHRALIAAAMADGESFLDHVLESDDTARTREILSAVGASFTRAGPGAFTVRGVAGKIRSREESLSCFVGESGTTCRLIAAVLAAGQGRFRLHGAGRMQQRPMAELCEALSGLGATIAFEERPGCLPLRIEAKGLDGSPLPGGMVSISCEESSQYLSGLLMAAPLTEKGLCVRLTGDKAVSWPYVSLTLDTLERFGVRFVVEERDEDTGSAWREIDWPALTEARPWRLRFRVAPGLYRAGRHSVEGDWSGASYFLAAGAVGPRSVRVEGLRPDSLQADAALLDILERMGARVTREDSAVTVHPAKLRGVQVDMGHCPDIVPTVAALAAHSAEGPTRISNVAHLRVKECDRLAAPAAELAKVGCRVEITEEAMTVTPPPDGLCPPPPDCRFSSYNDHRMAMSLSVLGLPGLSGSGGGFAVPLDDTACVAKSFPHFWELWAKVRA